MGNLIITEEKFEISIDLWEVSSREVVQDQRMRHLLIQKMIDAPYVGKFITFRNDKWTSINNWCNSTIDYKVTATVTREEKEPWISGLSLRMKRGKSGRWTSAGKKPQKRTWLHN